MSVTTETSSVEYTGNGAATSFPVPFKFLDGDDLVVKLKAPGSPEVQLVRGVHYSVNGAAQEAGGAVVLAAAPVDYATLTVERAMAVVQPTALRSQGTFAPAVHETAFDRLTMLVQQCMHNCEALEARLTALIEQVRSSIGLQAPAAQMTLADLGVYVGPTQPLNVTTLEQWSLTRLGYWAMLDTSASIAPITSASVSAIASALVQAGQGLTVVSRGIGDVGVPASPMGATAVGPQVYSSIGVQPSTVSALARAAGGIGVSTTAGVSDVSIALAAAAASAAAPSPSVVAAGTNYWQNPGFEAALTAYDWAAWVAEYPAGSPSDVWTYTALAERTTEGPLVGVGSGHLKARGAHSNDGYTDYYSNGYAVLGQEFAKAAAFVYDNVLFRFKPIQARGALYLRIRPRNDSHTNLAGYKQFVIFGTPAEAAANVTGAWTLGSLTANNVYDVVFPFKAQMNSVFSGVIATTTRFLVDVILEDNGQNVNGSEVLLDSFDVS